MENIERIRFLIWLITAAAGMISYMWQDFKINELKREGNKNGNL